MLASQLPEDIHDARMVMQAMTELLDTFLDKDDESPVPRPSNVLPFAAG